MQILVCVKRVPMVGGKIVILPNGQELDTRMSGFTVSPHEECAVEEAVRLTERYGGGVTVLTLGPAEAADQLRDMLALGASRAVLLETDGREWGPMATARAIVDAIRGGDGGYDLLLFGNESADTGGYQVPRAGRARARPALRYRDQGHRDHRIRRTRRRPGQAGVPGAPRRSSTSRCPR